MRTPRIRNAALLIACMAVTLTVVSPMPVYAHFLWIETDTQGEPGKPHGIRCYFGEPQEFLREEKGGRLDEMLGVHSQVEDPGGRVTDLTLKEEQNNFQSEFQPLQPGRYRVTASQLAHEVMDLTKYGKGVVQPRFYARTQVLAFSPGRVSERLEDQMSIMDLDIVPVTKHLNLQNGSISPWVGQEVVVRVIFKGQPLPHAKLFVYAPNGWQKELQTDSWGIAGFVPSWEGRYVLHIEQLEKTPGEFKGKPFEAIRHLATLSLFVIADGDHASK